jgi:hypothetical protein
MRHQLLLAAMTLAFGVASCSSASHLQPAERRVLQSMFGNPREPVPLDGASLVGRASRGEPQALHELFTKSVVPTLDGEYAETHTYDLARTLFELGDHRFAAALRSEPQHTRDRVLEFLSPLLLYHHLSCPQTESLSSVPDRLRRGLPLEPALTPNQTLQPTPSQLVSSRYHD